ncbi:hypothetical protein OIE66_35030 [Nonomuraea sp. NBC_01738]|uniref:hypothetical protein n=1 Tax=Nonomuraea sp. NBC_01738 TaxID=2976003 RepID=UPI002E166329|nr:hypothetical protein OIE66_35030 [Nonomuraea sp. NBC_01738]
MAEGQVDVHYKALDDCRIQVNWVGGRIDVEGTFKDIGMTAPAATTDSNLFGTLAGAHDLAGKMDKIWKSIGQEFTDAKAKLKATEDAISLVETNLRDANAANGA